MAKKLQITKDMMDKLHKGEEITIDGITFDFEMNEAKIEIDDETKFVIDLKHLLDKHVMKEGSCGYSEDVKTGKKLTTPGGLKETIQFISENNPELTKEEIVKEVQEIKKLGETLTEELCAKGKAYRKRRMAAGEKSSAYLSGRAVKVCKGQMSGRKKKKIMTQSRLHEVIQESLRDWFKKENWVRINTQGNIAGECGTMKKGKATTRCLPKKKAQSLTKAQRKATVAKKVRGSKKGKQFVKNTKKATYKKKK